MTKTKRKQLASLASRKRNVYKIHVDSKPEFKTTVQDVKQDLHGLKHTDLAEKTSRIFLSYRRRKGKNTACKTNRIETHQSISPQALNSKENGKSPSHVTRHRSDIDNDDDDDLSSWVEVKKQRVIIIIPALPKALPKHSISKQGLSSSKDVSRCKVPRKHPNARSRLLKRVPETLEDLAESAHFSEMQNDTDIKQRSSAKPNFKNSKGRRIADNQDKKLPSNGEHHMSGMDILVASALGTEHEDCQGESHGNNQVIQSIPEDQSLNTVDNNIRAKRLYSKLKQDVELTTARHKRYQGNGSQKEDISDNHLGTEKVCENSHLENLGLAPSADGVSERPHSTNVCLRRLPDKVSDKSHPEKVCDITLREKAADKCHLEKVSDSSFPEKVSDSSLPEKVSDNSPPEKVSDNSHSHKATARSRSGRVMNRYHSEKAHLKSVAERVPERRSLKIRSKHDQENLFCEKSHSENICKISPKTYRTSVEQNCVSEDVAMHDNRPHLHSMDKNENASSARMHMSSDLTANQAFRVSTLKRQLDRAGGIVEWLCLVGLHQFKDAFEQRTWSEAELLRLNMDDLKNMGKPAVGPRRKLLWTINHLSQQLM